MTLRSSYGELVPILVVAPAFFLFLLCQLLIFVFSSFLLFSWECDVSQLGQSLCSNSLIHFSYLPMAISREFFFIFNDVYNWKIRKYLVLHKGFGLLWVTYKVQIFWEGHKNLAHLPLFFDITLVVDWPNFCGLLWISEHYK